MAYSLTPLECTKALSQDPNDLMCYCCCCIQVVPFNHSTHRYPTSLAAAQRQLFNGTVRRYGGNINEYDQNSILTRFPRAQRLYLNVTIAKTYLLGTGTNQYKYTLSLQILRYPAPPPIDSTRLTLGAVAFAAVYDLKRKGAKLSERDPHQYQP